MIQGYLEALDLIEKCPMEKGEQDVAVEERILFTQPGIKEGDIVLRHSLI